MEQPTVNKLARNFQPKSIKTILSDAAKAKKGFTAWKMIGGAKIVSHLVLKIIRFNKNQIVFHIPSEEKSTLDNIVGKEKMLNFLITNESILFQSKIISLTTDEMIVEIPKMVAIQDRRSSLRCKIVDENVKLSFTKQITKDRFQKFEKKLFDLSKGGISFIMTASESEYFEKGDELLNVDLQVIDKLLPVSIVLVNLIDQDPDAENGLAYKGFKACFSFKEISEKQTEIIDNYVMTHVQYEKA